MKLNRSNLLTKGLLYAKSFGNMLEPDAVTNAPSKVLDFTSGISQSERYGALKYMACTGVTGDYFDTGISPTWANGDELTVCMLKRGSSGDEGSFIGQRDGTDIAWQIYNLNSSFSGQTYNVNISNQTIKRIGDSTTANDDNWHMIHVLFKFGTGGTVQLYVDGVADTLGAVSETRIPFSGALPLSVGMRWETYPGTGFERACDVAFVGLWDRRLTAGEIASHAQNPWQVFQSPPIIGAHQLPEHVNWGAIEVESQGPNGYTIDFGEDSRATLSPTPNGDFGTVDAVTDYGSWATSGNHEWNLGPDYLWSNDTFNRPIWGLSPSKFKFGPWQFSEVDVYVTVTSQQTDNVWVGPAVFIAGQRADTGWNDNNMYAVLVQQCGGGTATYRLYKRRSQTWFSSSSEGGPGDATGMIDCAIRPVRLRIEAMDNGSSTHVRWWIDGIEQPSWNDTNALRIQYQTNGVNAQADLSHSYAGASWGGGVAENKEDRKITRLRAGNMPEIKIKRQVVPINEDLPDLVKFEVPE